MMWAAARDGSVSIHAFTEDGRADDGASGHVAFEGEPLGLIAHDDGSSLLYGSLVARVKSGALDETLRFEGESVRHLVETTGRGYYAIVGDTLRRVTPDGVPDPTFASQPAKDVSELFTDTSGRVVVMRASSEGTVLERHTTTGSLDRTYGKKGSASLFGLSAAHAFPVASGELLVAGRMAKSTRVTRLSLEGAIVDAFPGRPTVDLVNEAEVSSESTDGKLLVRIGGGAVARWNADGTSDPTFGAFNVTSPSEVVRAVRVTASGAVMVATVDGPTLRVRRLAR
jgi:hypothetical protein